MRVTRARDPLVARHLAALVRRNFVVDSASIEVNRRARQLKTDRLDLVGLVNLLARYRQGDQRAWRVVHVPSVSAEDARQPDRMRETLQQERGRVINRLKGLRAIQGLRLPLHEDFLVRLEEARLWDGTPVPPGLKQRLTSAWQHLAFLTQQVAALDTTRETVPLDSETGRYVERLQSLRAIGVQGARVLATEIFGWRAIRNRRELAALVGLVPKATPAASPTQDAVGPRAVRDPVCSQNRIRSKSAWGHGDLPQKPRFPGVNVTWATRVEPAGGRDLRHRTILIAF